MNSIGPVVADGRRMAIFVRGENQAVFRFAVIEDVDNVWITRAGSLRKIEVERAIFAKKRVWRPIERDSIHGQISEVDIYLPRRFDDGQIDARTRGCDLSELIVERDVDEVMCGAPRVDQALDARREDRGREKYY